MAILKCAIFILSLYVLGALAGRDTCGKRSYKAGFGSQKTFKSLTTPGVLCRYKIRAPKGLHIKFTMDNSATGLAAFKVYDASKKGFSWRPSEVLAVIDGTVSEENERTFEAKTVGVESVGSSPTPRISFEYSAVIPSDNNFGFDDFATNKVKSLRTPGFPKISLGSGIRSTWNIKSKDSKPVFLLINKLKTASDQDYVEVYDGTKVLGKFTGKLNPREPEPELVAQSGQMKIYLHTETSGSKGFKATYQTIEETGTLVPDTGLTGGLKCHNRNRVKSGGATVHDTHSTIICPSGHVCGRMVMEGKANIPGSALMTSEMLNCIPTGMCKNTKCETMPPPPDTDLLSCTIACCSTNMCNGSPDGPEVPPITDAQPSHYTPYVEETGMQCHMRSEVKMGEMRTGGAAGGYGCGEKEICALYVFKGTGTDENGNTVQGGGYAAKCELESECNQEGCLNIDESNYINITSCQVNCCKTDRCNTPPDEHSITPPPPSGGDVTECYDILSSTAGGISVIDNANVAKCIIPDSRCSKIHLRANATGGAIVEMVYGACVPSAMCSSLNCDVLSSSMPGISIESCEASCCDTNLCNRKDSEVVSPSVGASECYEILSTKVGSSTIIDNRKVSKCNLPNSRCSRIDVVASSPDGSTTAMAVYGTCVPAAACNSLDCSVIAGSMAGLNVKSCDASCCTGDLCNAFPEAHVEPELPLPTVEQTRLSCYDMLDIQASGVSVPTAGKKDEQLCDPGSRCMRVVAVATHKRYSAIKVKTIIGSCQPSFMCISMDCSSMSNPMPDVKIESCETSCCDTDFCNE